MEQKVKVNLYRKKRCLLEKMVTITCKKNQVKKRVTN